MPWGGRGGGRGFGRGFGYFGGGAWPAFGWGRGSWGWPGNPYPFCRQFPWLPRWWWSGMYGPIGPSTTMPTSYPQYGTPYGYPQYPYPTSYGTW